jgi:hypothetical protein
MVSYYNVSNYDPATTDNGLLIASIVITGFVFLSSLLMIIVYKLYWKKLYHNEKIVKAPKFKHLEWRSLKCDDYFRDIENLKEMNS